VATVHDSLFAGGLALLKGTHGRPATWTKQSSGATTSLSLLLLVNDDGLTGVARVVQADLATAPLKDDSFVLTSSTTRWYVTRARDRESPDADYVVEVSSNATE
jgi:hypothetical protein